MEFFILVISPCVVPLLLLQKPLIHCPFLWLATGICLSASCVTSFWAEPEPMSVILYFCQLPFLWSFYYMFFIRGHYADSLCVAIGLCVTNFVMLMQYFTIHEAAGWLLLPHVASVCLHTGWNMYSAWKVDERASSTSGTVCAAQGLPLETAIATAVPECKA